MSASDLVAGTSSSPAARPFLRFSRRAHLARPASGAEFALRCRGRSGMRRRQNSTVSEASGEGCGGRAPSARRWWSSPALSWARAACVSPAACRQVHSPRRPVRRDVAWVTPTHPTGSDRSGCTAARSARPCAPARDRRRIAPAVEEIHPGLTAQVVVRALEQPGDREPVLHLLGQRPGRALLVHENLHRHLGGDQRERPGHGVGAIVVRVRRMVDRIPPAARRAAFEPE